MAEVLGIIGAIATSAHVLHLFADQVTRWKRLSDRLFDIEEGLRAAELTLEMWRRKWDIQERRPDIYLHTLFGRFGWERIEQTLGSIKIVSRTISKDIDAIVGRAKRYRPRSTPQSQLDADFDERLVRECVRRIGKRLSWGRKFNYSVLGKAQDLEIELDRLNRKLTVLERYAEAYVEREYADRYHGIKRLPGRRVIYRIGDPRLDYIQKKLLGAIAARKDAELLHRASGQENHVHIGLSVPQIHKHDFAFLLSIKGKSHEVLVHPVQFGRVTDRSKLKPNISSAVPALLSSPQEACNMLPPDTPLTAGFQVSIPPRNLLLDMEYNHSLRTLINNANPSLVQQGIYSQDQVALACGIVTGSFRLLGSKWLQFMDSRNIRWRRGLDGNWTCMMATVDGDTSVTRTLDAVIAAGLARRPHLNLTKHCHIFRIGLLLVELALKVPITYIDFNAQTGGVRIYITELGSAPLTAMELVGWVETRTNVFYGNMVAAMLAVLQDSEVLEMREVDGVYYKEVLSQAEELEGIVKGVRRWGTSGAGTPI
jgi:hypothetical protein